MKDYRMEQAGMGEPPRAIPVYDAYNGHYLSMQHHLNASVLYNFKVGKTAEKLKGTIGLSLFNIYKQDNVYSREYFIETPKNNPWIIVTNDKRGLKLTPNMVVRIFW